MYLYELLLTHVFLVLMKMNTKETKNLSKLGRNNKLIKQHRCKSSSLLINQWSHD